MRLLPGIQASLETSFGDYFGGDRPWLGFKKGGGFPFFGTYPPLNFKVHL